MSNVLTALWPVFALIVAGYFLKVRQFPGDVFWPGAERLNYFCLFPALLFYNLSQAPLTTAALQSLGGLALLCMVVGFCLLLCAQRYYRWPGQRFGVFTQGGLRFNTYLGLAIVGALYGAPGLALAAMMLTLLVPLVNVFSVVSLTAGHRPSVLQLVLPIVKNPLILACLAGAAANLSGLTLGQGVEVLLKQLSATSLPLGLLCVGAALQPKTLLGEAKPLMATAVLKLVMMPAVAMGAAWLAGLPSQEAAILVIFFALPCAPTAYVLTKELGGDSRLMAAVITLQTALAAVTLTVWLYSLRYFQ
ncbi:AEC family transporter [Halioxenophilus aromaticivorans]|uniref:AEC family transporter n=1 Tax=Halioxenophilus aromaticivorans TaxID=1306992 RepID=A0AAV3U774_9ALTE